MKVAEKTERVDMTNEANDYIMPLTQNLEIARDKRWQVGRDKENIHVGNNVQRRQVAMKKSSECALLETARGSSDL